MALARTIIGRTTVKTSVSVVQDLDYFCRISTTHHGSKQFSLVMRSAKLKVLETNLTKPYENSMTSHIKSDNI